MLHGELWQAAQGGEPRQLGEYRAGDILEFRIHSAESPFGDMQLSNDVLPGGGPLRGHVGGAGGDQSPAQAGAALPLACQARNEHPCPQVIPKAHVHRHDQRSLSEGWQSVNRYLAMRQVHEHFRLGVLCSCVSALNIAAGGCAASWRLPVMGCMLNTLMGS